MAQDWEAMALVGRIARAHGSRGEVIVNPETDFPEERFSVGARVHVRADARVTILEVRGVRFHRGRPILALGGVETMTDAGRLAGLEMRVPVTALHPLPDGAYYQHDLVGCSVETRAGAVVGTVSRVGGAAGNTWLEIDSADGPVLVPFAAAVCVEIDTPGRRIVVELPEGLLEANR